MRQFTTINSRSLIGISVSLAVIFACAQAEASVVTYPVDRAGAIHDPAGSGNITPTTDYYGSGNDDNFSEYGVATFTSAAADFGGTVTSINSVTFSITHNDRPFADGSSFSLWLTSDDFDATYSPLSYDSTLFNGFDTADFTSVTSLGQFNYAPAAGGTVETLMLSLTAAQQSTLITEINAGSEFSIVITADNAADDVTFTGDNDQFEPGGMPLITIDAVAVPEPSALGLLLISLLGLVWVRRQ